MCGGTTSILAMFLLCLKESMLVGSTMNRPCSIAACPSIPEPGPPVSDEKVSYVLCEFACSKDSRLGHDKYARYGDKLVIRIRLTEDIDMCSEGGLQYAMEQLKPYVGKVPVFLWGSLPCTLGSPWQNLNSKRPGWETRRKFLSTQFVRLHRNFMKIAQYVRQHENGHVCYEWPKRCSLWRDPRIVRMIKLFKMDMVHINGCMLGLKSAKGLPILKPWTLRSTFPELIRFFSKDCLCNKSHDHDQAAGSETAKTAYYPPLMCDKIHDAFRAHIAYLNSDPNRNEIMFRYLHHSRAGDKRDSIEALDAWLHAEDESEQRTADASTQGGDRNLVDNYSRAKPVVVEHAKSPEALATSVLRIPKELNIKTRVHVVARGLLL
jgi:hypothetical protein